MFASHSQFHLTSTRTVLGRRPTLDARITPAVGSVRCPDSFHFETGSVVAKTGKSTHALNNRPTRIALDRHRLYGVKRASSRTAVVLTSLCETHVPPEYTKRSQHGVTANSMTRGVRWVLFSYIDECLSSTHDHDDPFISSNSATDNLSPALHTVFCLRASILFQKC